MKARGGFTLIELLLAGAILATISLGALIGTLRINKIIGDRSDLMAADGYCWDVAWSLFNSDYDDLQRYITKAEDKGCRALEITGRVAPAKFQQQGARRYEFLSHLQYGDTAAGWPTCYIILSNALDSAGQKVEDGICISVNLEWGPEGHRSIMMPRPGVDMTSMKTVYDHPVSIFKSKFSRTLK